MADEAIITAIKPLPSDPTRVAVRVGRRTVAKLPREAVDELGLAVGERWSEALAARVERAAGADEARRDALRLINRRDYSTGELADRLVRKDHPRNVADAVVESLAQRRMIDDEAYGRSVIERELARRPAGRRLLEQKLARKKLPRRVIDALLAEHASDDQHDEAAAARELALRKLAAPSMMRLEPRRRRQRVWSLLARRGFSPAVISAALAGLGDRLGDDDEPSY